MPGSKFDSRVVIRFALLLITLSANLCHADDEDSESSWRRLFDTVSRKYQLLRDADSDAEMRLQLKDGPVYVWGRPQQQGSTYGTVYVWTLEGTAAAVACIWRYVNPGGQRAIVHELHSLSPVKVHSEGEFDTWKARAGVSRQPIPGLDGLAASTAAARMQQMRGIGRNFALHSVSESR